MASKNTRLCIIKTAVGHTCYCNAWDTLPVVNWTNLSTKPVTTINNTRIKTTHIILGEVLEKPDISKANSTANSSQQEGQFAVPSFSFFFTTFRPAHLFIFTTLRLAHLFIFTTFRLAHLFIFTTFRPAHLFIFTTLRLAHLFIFTTFRLAHLFIFTTFRLAHLFIFTTFRLAHLFLFTTFRPAHLFIFTRSKFTAFTEFTGL